MMPVGRWASPPSHIYKERLFLALKIGICTSSRIARVDLYTERIYVSAMVPKAPPGADPPVFPSSGSGNEMPMVTDGLENKS